MGKTELIARVGNFEISNAEDAEGQRTLRIQSVSGHWGVCYREDNEMYGKVMAMVREYEVSAGAVSAQAQYGDGSSDGTGRLGKRPPMGLLEMHVLWLYHMTSLLIDAELASDVFLALERMRDRMAAREVSGFGLQASGEEDAALAEGELLAGTASLDLS